jgi:hypothetical protein
MEKESSETDPICAHASQEKAVCHTGSEGGRKSQQGNGNSFGNHKTFGLQDGLSQRPVVWKSSLCWPMGRQ